MLLYLHGFRSSPRSAKATQMAARMRELGLLEHFRCPQLPASPKAAMALARSFGAGPGDTIVGSSLGGFYATFLAQETGARCVAINPSVDPVSGAPRFVGIHTMYHSDDPFEFRPEYVDELREFYVGGPPGMGAEAAVPVPAPVRTYDPSRWMLIAAKGDELLDWRDMVGRYPGARHRVLEGSDHGMVDDFPAMIDDVLAFAGLLPSPARGALVAPGGAPDPGAAAMGAGTSAIVGASAPTDHYAGKPLKAGDLAASARRVQDALDAAGLATRVVELTVSARTAQEAADALGVAVGQIAKSLVFRGSRSGRAVLVIAAGDNRVSEQKVGALAGEPIERAPAAFVREQAGFAIGGIPPLGHATPMLTFVDATMARFPVVWAAGGTPHAVFPIEPARLFALAGVSVRDVALA